VHKYGTGFLTLGGSGFLSRQKVITGSLELSGSFSVVRIKLPTRGRLLVVAAGRLGGGVIRDLTTTSGKRLRNSYSG